MGAKQTKMEGSYLPETPVTKCKTSQIINTVANADANLDPRSPAGCRTPIILQTKPNTSNVQISCTDITEPDRNNEKTIDVLRKRFLRSFTYNIYDPRSPSLNLNRTPIVFEDAFEKPLSLDDTFSNLFVETVLPNAINKVVQPEEIVDKMVNKQDPDNDHKEKIIIDLEQTAMEQHSPVALQQEFDPRSPSIGVERTPIIFTDDEIDETNEDIMLESILATLSLDMNSSSNSSVMSRKSQNESISSYTKTNMRVIPVNKHLEGVRTGRKNGSKLKNIKPKRRISQRKIYEDQENHTPSTPVLKTRQADKKNHLRGSRTPLSCVRNRNDVYIRSRSVESSATSIKTRLALTSFDDALNPTEKYSVPNLRILQQSSQDSLDLN